MKANESFGDVRGRVECSVIQLGPKADMTSKRLRGSFTFDNLHQLFAQSERRKLVDTVSRHFAQVSIDRADAERAIDNATELRELRNVVKEPCAGTLSRNPVNPVSEPRAGTL